ncbi:UNVERIFIED_ORG: mannonate oxidoreductase [Clostridium botulinum]
MNNITIEKLNYENLKEIVKSYCISNLGKNLIDKIIPSTNLKQVNRMLNETSEGRKLIDASYHMPLEGIFDINPLLNKMEKGAVLEPSELVTIGDFLRGCRKVKLFIKDKQGYAPTLSSYGENITELQYVEDEISISIKGTVIDSNATKELKKIRKHIDLCEGKINEKLEKFIKSQSNREYLQEAFVSQRNGRYTVPIKASYKNQVSGSIVEVSSKGNTVFMEPNIISKYTVELASLRGEESIEEYKILATLTEMIFSRIRELKVNVEVISEYDMILAKAKYSKDIKGVKPKLNNRGFINIVDGRYPLIKNSIPLNLKIGEKYRSLIITGPNAGGKTVVLKTVGILMMAIQSGFHISANENSEMAVFDNIFVDIGDDQSVENSLSTFSSHVGNLSRILRESTKNTLLLFDEIGSGTEPNEGAALAIAILEEFYKKGCITVASTHYGEIKNFSYNHPHFENAAMEFKKDTLEPMYRLNIGMSGESNALYIAKKMGIDDVIIDRSKRYFKSKEYNYEIIDSRKLLKNKTENENSGYENIINEYDYKIGDKVLLLDKKVSALVYKTKDRFNNVVVFLNNEFIEVNFKRLKLEFTVEELYPKDYDLNQLFVSFKERKLDKDLKRGSKKAIKKFRKEEKIK